MKRVLALLLIASAAIAANVRFAWDTHPEQTMLSGFRFYEINTTQTNLIGTLKPDQYTFRYNFSLGEHSVFVTAVGGTGVESDPSNVVTFYVPKPPGNVTIVVQ